MTAFHTVSIKDFNGFFTHSGGVGIGNDFYAVDTTVGGSLDIIGQPVRFDGYFALFCVEGRLRLSVNASDFVVEENSLFVNIPGNVIRISSLERLHFVLVAMSSEYMAGLKMDLHKLFSESMFVFRNPVFSLDADEKAVAAQYFSLMNNVFRSPLLYKNECVGSLLSSFFYLAGGVIDRRVAGTSCRSDVRNMRNREIFDRFMELVAEHHTVERSVGFYAGRLFLTPKYLSKLVKETSGRSAPQWIDSYVLLEARNMLKYSDMPIKEIASRLSFPDAASFHRFFRSHTACTPMEYRHSR